ncbi:MAG: hypothetical protein ABL872_00445 [Lacibacter sp.]
MKKSLITLCLFSLFISCRKNNSDSIQFPEETQSGLNTFGCYIDDKAFIPATTLFGNVQPIHVYYTPDSTQYYKAGFLSIQGIDARYSLDFAGDVLLQKLQVFGIGEYSLNHAFNCANPYNCDGGGYYNAKEGKTYFIESGKLTITRLDTLNKIISGRFYFTSKDTFGNRKEIKAGVFDTRYIN